MPQPGLSSRQRARIIELVGFPFGSHLYSWTMFDAGRALNWPLLVIPTPTESASGKRQFDELVEKFLGPVCESVTDAQAVLERLLRTDVPFDWGATNPVTRSAAVIAIAMACGADVESVVDRLRSHQSRQIKIYRTGDKWRFTLDSLVGILTLAADKTAANA